MRKTVVALLPLAIVGAVAVGLVNCGGTGGTGSGFGNQFVNTSCGPDSNCLEFSSPSSVTVGEEGSFRARLTDGSGNSMAGIQICFEVENSAGTITSPPGGCGITDSNGVVSGSVRGDIPGSHIITARAPSGFGLTVRNSIRFTEAESCTEDPSVCTANQFCAIGGGACDFPDDTCVALQRNGGCCEANSQCISGFCDGGECASPPDPECADGLDNDGDGDIDFPDDGGCANVEDNDETGP